MKIFTVIYVLISSSGFTKEWAVIDGLSPTRKQELVTIPVFEHDEPNGTPFRVALRDAASKLLLDSFLWEGDMGDPQAHKRNKACWSPDGRYVAVAMRTGRLSATTAYFLVEHGRLIRVTAPDVWQKVLGTFKTSKAGPNGGTSPVAWTNKNHLTVCLIGSAETTSGRIPFHDHAIFAFDGGAGVVPSIHLENVEPAKDDSE